MMAEQALQEAIIDLRKQNLNNQTQHLIEEASRLLDSGRDIEARALIEKAQAISATTIAPDPAVPAKVAGAAAAEPASISRISARLAQGITAALTAAIADLHHDFGQQMKDIVSSLEDQIGEMAAHLRHLPHVQQRLDRIEQEEPARAGLAQERWDRLSTAIAVLEENDRARRAEAEEWNRNLSAELKTIVARVSVQEESLAAFGRLIDDLSPKVHSVIKQMDRQNHLIQSIRERQAHRAAALNEVLDTIARLRFAEDTNPDVLGHAVEAP